LYRSDIPVKVVRFYLRLCHQKRLTSLFSSEKLSAIPFRMLPAAKTNSFLIDQCCDRSLVRNYL
ncbi:MAG: hypothetical protein ACK470_11280, partial [Pseudanabaena sp.]